jgi:hypothetical protein
MDSKTEMRVVSPEEERAQEILRQKAGWDGGYPIAVKWDGNAQSEDVKKVKVIQASGDDHCYWVADAVSALVLFEKGHSLETSPLVLAKRVTFRGR